MLFHWPSNVHDIQSHRFDVTFQNVVGGRIKNKFRNSRRPFYDKKRPPPAWPAADGRRSSDVLPGPSAAGEGSAGSVAPGESIDDSMASDQSGGDAAKAGPDCEVKVLEQDSDAGLGQGEDDVDDVVVADVPSGGSPKPPQDLLVLSEDCEWLSHGGEQMQPIRYRAAGYSDIGL